MSSFAIVVLVAILSLVSASQRQPYEVSVLELKKSSTYDCGATGNDPFKLVSLDISPDPIIYPGAVDLKINATLAEDLPSDKVMMKLAILKVEPYRMTVPCFRGIGSCTYNVCGDMIPNHQAQFCNIGACSCPLKAGTYTNLGKDPMHVELPNMGGSIIGKILQGNFEANVTFYNSDTAEEYACLGMNFAIKAKE